MVKKLPKNCRDWHQDLIRCASARYNSRVRLRRKDYGEWMKAKELLNASNDPIYIQPTGQYKGQVVGIPKKIGPNIYQYLCDVVKEARPVIHPEDAAQPLADFNVLNPDGTVRPQVDQNEPTPQIENIPWVIDRKYRDSAYSVLASMYTQLRPERHLQLKTSQVTSGMRGFTDLEIEYDYRTRKNGAFKSMDQLVDKGLVHKTKNGGFTGGNCYSLTRNGLRVCYYLFHVKFSPTANPTYALVRPIGNCVATADGNVQEIGGQPGLPRIPQVPNIPFGGGAGTGAGVGFGDYNHNNNNMYPDDMGGMFGDDFGYDEGNIGGHDFYGGSGAKKAGAGGAKRAYDDLDNNEAKFTLDADEIRNKRLKHFGHIATPAAKKAASSTSGAKVTATSSSIRPTTTQSATTYPATPTSSSSSGIHNPVHYTQSSTIYPSSFEYSDNNETDSQAADELEEIQLQSILAYSEQEARLEALYREEQRMLELQERTQKGDTYNSADEEEEGEYEIRQEIYYKGQRVPDSADRPSSAAGGSSTSAHRNSSMREDYNAKPSAYDPYSNASSSSNSKAAAVINLDYPTTSSNTISTATVSAKPQLINSTTNSDNDSEDEDYRRAIAESMLTDSVVNKQALTSGTIKVTTMPVNDTSTTTMDSSLDDVIYVETPRKTTVSTTHTSTSSICRIRDYGASTLSTPSNSQKSTRMVENTAPREIITVDESQEESQDITFCSPDKTTGKYATCKVSESVARGNNQDVVLVDTPPSRDVTNRKTPVATTTAAKPEVYELDDSQNDISITLDTRETIDTLDTMVADSPDVVILPVSMSASVVKSVAKGKQSTIRDTPEVRNTLDSGSTLAPRATTSRTCSLLSAVHEINDTPPPPCREEVITIDDSQSQNVYPEFSSAHAESEMFSDVHDLSQSPAHKSNSSARESSIASVGAGKLGRGSAMLAAYATLTQPSPAVTKSHSILSVPDADTANTIQFTPIYLSTVPTTITTTITDTLPLCTIPLGTVPSTANKLVLLVDVRERNKNAFYRTFFFDIQAKCNTHLTLSNTSTTSRNGTSGTITDYSVEQDKLELGDIAVAYEADSSMTTSSSHYISMSNSSTTASTTGDTETDTTDSTYYLTGLVVERKALSDLISSSAGDARSRCGTARHFVQECRMRHSGCKRAFMCIEGSMNMANIHAVPLVWRDRDFTHPDIIENVEGIVSYMCALIGRNYSLPNTVRVVQSVSPSATCQLLAAMMAVEIYLANTSHARTNTTSAESYTLSLPRKSDFDKYFRSMGASKRGRESELRQSLEVPIAPVTSGLSNTMMYEDDREVSAEMIERLVRRFGCWDALLSAYKQCYTSQQSMDGQSSTSSGSIASNPVNYSTAVAANAEIRCMMLLCELTVGGTLTDRTNLTTSSSTTSNTSISAESTALLQDSLLVWHHARRMLCAEGFLQYNSTNSGLSTTISAGTSHTHSRNELVPQVAEYLDSLYTSILTIQPRKVTLVAISVAMRDGALSQYSSLDSSDFVCQLLSLTASTPSTSTDGVTIDAQPSTGRKRKADIIPGGTCTYLNCHHQQYPFMYIQSVDTNEYKSGTFDTVSVQRSSMRTVVGIVSALDVVEAIIVSTAHYKAQHTNVDWRVVSVFAENHRSIEIIREAIVTLGARLPVEFSSSGDVNTDGDGVKSAHTQCVLIVEGLIHSTSPSATAMGKLESALNSSAGVNNNSSNGNSDSGTHTLSLGHGRPSLPLAEARDVSANQAWLVQLFVACVSMTGISRSNISRTTSEGEDENSSEGCQCFLTQNAEQTERFVYSLIHETHRQSLLLF
eukprot:gene8289-9858_t